MAKRIGFILVLILSGFVLTGFIVMYLAFSAGPQAPRSIETEAVERPALISWSSQGTLSVSASSFDDALIALGYGHVRSRSWQMVLWRKTALGELAEWFGENAVEIDRLMKQLDIADDAIKAWDSMDAESRESLNKYTTGINLAISSNDLNRGTPFLLLDIESAPWQPWHTIAVERLFSWIAGEAFAREEAIPTARADRSLRELLHIYGFDINSVTAVQNDDLNFIATRYGTGDSGVPFFVETELDYASGSFSGLTVPGTLVTPVGRTHADSWALLLGGTANRENVLTGETPLVRHLDRIDHAEREELVTTWRMGNAMLLRDSDRASSGENVEVISWTGFESGSDTAEWVAALKGNAPRPTLLSLSGLATRGEVWEVMGAPETVFRDESGVLFVTSADESLSPVRTVEMLGSPGSASDLLENHFSQAAREDIPDLIARIPDSLLTDEADSEALRYLTNWNHVYGAAETGASIAETMIRDVMPGYPSNNSTLVGQLHETVRRLSARYGTDMSSWRWENVQERSVRFPGTTSLPADAGRTETSFYNKYQPVLMSGPGHPQTFMWGAVRLPQRLPITSAWEGAIANLGGEFLFRRPSVEFDVFLGTFITADRPPELQTFQRSESAFSTTLNPADE